MGLPIPNLDDKSFEDLVKEARALIARYAPQWTDHNLHDPGITFLELFAWLAEMQVYQLNRLTDRSYVNFLKLVGLEPAPPRPARIHARVFGADAPKVVAKGTTLSSYSGEDQVCFETEEDFPLVPTALASIVVVSAGKRAEKIQANDKDDIYFSPFDDHGALLELGFDSALPVGTDLGLYFDLCHGDDGRGEPGKAVPLVRLSWEYLAEAKEPGWRAIPGVEDSTSALAVSGRVAFRWPSVIQKGGLFWIRCRLAKGSYPSPPVINAILLNTLSALQVESVADESRGTGFPGAAMQLKKAPLPETLNLEIAGEGIWEPVAQFDASGPEDRHYLFDPVAGTVSFGNGLNGRIPKQEQRIWARYRTTLGAKGNLPAGPLLLNGEEGLTCVSLGPSTGGKDAESLDQAKERARRELQVTSRAVTASDFEELAIGTPGIAVQRAKALPGYHADYPCVAMPGAVTVVVLPAGRQGGPPPVTAPPLLEAVTAYLETRRLVTTVMKVVGPEYVPVGVSCSVHPSPKADPSRVREEVLERLRTFLDPFTGGSDQQGWPFGRPVYPSEIYQLLDKTDGVQYAAGVRLKGKGLDGDGIVRLSPIALVVSAEHSVVII